MESTQDGKIIENWVKERKGVPAIVQGTKDLLRIRFDSLEEELIPITWYEFFKMFEANNLKFLYDDTPDSRFCKFVEE